MNIDSRALALMTFAALAIGACGKEDQANNTVNIDQAVLSDDLAANDVTAIDAVTGDAANMAAEVDINFTKEMLPATNEAGSAKPGKGRSPSATTPANRPATPAPAEPASNSATNATE